KKGLEKYKFDPPKDPAVLDQKGCMYVPHVFGIMVNQDLKIRSSDNFLHNVNNKDNNLNLAFPAAGHEEVRPKLFKKEGPTKFQCEVHPWMSAYAYVSKTPFFAVTDENGKYEIKGLPAGKYTLGVWHEAYPGLKAAPAEIDVEVLGDEAKTQDFVFDLK
ncbi:MAG TPA: hypothetical protein VMT52_13830, partial [Planctomycetota bacterium]|nr:hypothetical protein [Planctomycetota bacterium]